MISVTRFDGKIVKKLMYCTCCDENPKRLRYVYPSNLMATLCKRCLREYGKEKELMKLITGIGDTRMQSLKRRYLREGFPD